jgi:hypothetical protein
MRMSQELVRVNVDDLCSEDGGSGVHAETRVSRVQLELEDAVDLHISLREASGVDKPMSRTQV